MAAWASSGSLVGAVFADAFPSNVPNVVVLLALVAVGVYTWCRPALGTTESQRFNGRAQLLMMITGGAVIGFWDGIAGPGTGSFLFFSW